MIHNKNSHSSTKDDESEIFSHHMIFCITVMISRLVIKINNCKVKPLNEKSVDNVYCFIS